MIINILFLNTNKIGLLKLFFNTFFMNKKHALLGMIYICL